MRKPPRQPARIADVDEFTGTDLEPFNTPFWRALALPWGGLLTTAAGALELVRTFLGIAPGFLHAETVTLATQNQAGNLGGGIIGGIGTAILATLH